MQDQLSPSAPTTGQIALRYLLAGPLLYVFATFASAWQEIGFPVGMRYDEQRTFIFTTFLLPVVLGFNGALIVRLRSLEWRMAMAGLCGAIPSAAIIIAYQARLAGPPQDRLPWVCMIFLPLLCSTLCDWYASGRPFRQAGWLVRIVVATSFTLIVMVPALISYREVNRRSCERQPGYELDGLNHCHHPKPEVGQ